MSKGQEGLFCDTMLLRLEMTVTLLLEKVWQAGFVHHDGAWLRRDYFWIEVWIESRTIGSVNFDTITGIRASISDT